MTQSTETVTVTDDSSLKKRTIVAKAFAAPGASSPLAPFSFARRAPQAEDVQLEISIVASVTPICTRRAMSGKA